MEQEDDFKIPSISKKNVEHENGRKKLLGDDDWYDLHCRRFINWVATLEKDEDLDLAATKLKFMFYNNCM